MAVRHDKLVPALKRLLDEDRIDGIGRSVAFIRRLRQLSASAFVWAVVLSRFGSGRPGFEQARQWYARLTAVLLWPRPFQVRFKSPATVRLFQQTFDEVKRAFRKQAVRHHPDVNQGDATATARFVKATEAFEVLSDPEKRAVYDSQLHAQRQALQDLVNEWRRARAAPAAPATPAREPARNIVPPAVSPFVPTRAVPPPVQVQPASTTNVGDAVAIGLTAMFFGAVFGAAFGGSPKQPRGPDGRFR